MALASHKILDTQEARHLYHDFLASWSRLVHLSGFYLFHPCCYVDSCRIVDACGASLGLSQSLR